MSQATEMLNEELDARDYGANNEKDLRRAIETVQEEEDSGRPGTALATVGNREITPSTWEMVMRVAPVFAASRMFDVTEPQAAVTLVKGLELGLSIGDSFEFIHVIQGKPSLSPRGAMALLWHHPEFNGIEIVETEGAAENGKWEGLPYSCAITVYRKPDYSYTALFTMDDAKRAGIIKSGGGWETYPDKMLKWRAVGYAIDYLFSDLGGGMKRADEYGSDLTPEGDVIEGSWSEVPAYESSTAKAARKEAEKQEADAVVNRQRAREILQTVETGGADEMVQALMDEMNLVLPVARALFHEVVSVESSEALKGDETEREASAKARLEANNYE